MIKRILSAKLKQAARQFPIVTVTGPRQSGKTTLVRAVFKNYHYISLELPDQRQFALEDPHGNLQEFLPQGRATFSLLLERSVRA